MSSILKSLTREIQFFMNSLLLLQGLSFISQLSVRLKSNGFKEDINEETNLT